MNTSIKPVDSIWNKIKISDCKREEINSADNQCLPFIERFGWYIHAHQGHPLDYNIEYKKEYTQDESSVKKASMCKIRASLKSATHRVNLISNNVYRPLGYGLQVSSSSHDNPLTKCSARPIKANQRECLSFPYGEASSSLAVLWMGIHSKDQVYYFQF